MTASSWGDEDRALMLAWRQHMGGIHEPCGHPTATAFHHMNDDAFEKQGDFICWACTAAQDPDENGDRKPVRIPVVVDTRDYARFPLPGPPEPIDDRA